VASDAAAAVKLPISATFTKVASRLRSMAGATPPLADAREPLCGPFSTVRAARRPSRALADRALFARAGRVKSIVPFLATDM
jgi:hypothetical protein